MDFFGVCMDQIYNQAAKFRYMFGGKARTPMVIRTMYGAGIRAASQHSQSLYPIFTHIPGLKVVVPSNPYDAKGLLIASIRDDDPVIFFENKVLYNVEGEVPEEPYVVPLGEAEYVREGDDVTIVAIGRMVSMAEQAAEQLADEGIECEIVDPRTTSPLDEETIFESVENTGRLVVVDEANPRCSLATDIVARVAQNCFDDLEGRPQDGDRAPHPAALLTDPGGPLRPRPGAHTPPFARQPVLVWRANERDAPDLQTRHAKVGPHDDRGDGDRVARRGAASSMSATRWSKSRARRSTT